MAAKRAETGGHSHLGCAAFEMTSTADGSGRVSAPLAQRRSPLADLLKRHFEAATLLRAQFGEHYSHLPGMLSER